MKFSLIIGTLNRDKEIRYCLESLFNQSFNDYEIIVIDQSDNKRTEKYIQRLERKNIKYIHVDYKGLSKARNDGLMVAKGEYVCLIDDDANYNESYLDIANKYVSSDTILSGHIISTKNNKPYVAYIETKNQKYLNQREVIRTCPSAGLVIPKRLFERIGDFDERFGVGAKYGSGEETDILLRGMRVGYNVMYVNSMILRHPYPIKKEEISYTDEKMLKRAKYLEGLGALIKKHSFELDNKSIMKTYYETKIKLYTKLLVSKEKKYIKRQLDSFNNGYKKYEIDIKQDYE